MECLMAAGIDRCCWVHSLFVESGKVHQVDSHQHLRYEKFSRRSLKELELSRWLNKRRGKLLLSGTCG